MVLESLISPLKAEKEPWEMFFVGIMYSSIAIFLALFVFGGDEMSLVIVFLTVMACGILMYRTMKYEEHKDLEIKSERKLLRQHGKALSLFLFLFLGFLVSFALWYVFLPGELAQQVFSMQISTIKSINSNVQGMITVPFSLLKILSNNIKVLLFSLFFSFFYGMGAIFILTWNASVVGAATGIAIKNSLSAFLAKAGAVGFAGYFTAISVGLLRYLLHGIPEIAAYFIGGLAGGLISVAVINHKENNEEFKKVMKDASWLILISLVILVIAAFLEVYVTPIFF
ncbi:stage II sporulation protein M [Candidatus Woesearchaeota archaeon]|jgi:uncharacterized membrane protein SpoIIM required for sporulation|nr:stage II sporulation protein M [Candidatus Woesearchaeota archaeon]MBT4367763.1 stage II sporulation protein M [Candidatus Woesearchaeota archaeon]MBT4712251.1 stage II sporulation protein M [Candidatus Woesearchaeota archaeon]MBT6638799.1 stage II sporulation protein M [Candidatus Woesearchaeota archaeon]MBT7134443.1 stage II sporulation protein M [Candidatus Woesearchaeota archaeon]